MPPLASTALIRFFKTPKGLLTIILATLLTMAIPSAGIALVAPGLGSACGVAAFIDALILRVRRGAWEFPSGAVLTGLIIAMVLSPHEPWYVAGGASALAVVSKYMLRTRSANVFNPAAPPQEYLYEPAPGSIFEAMLPKHVEVQVWRALLESAAAEHGARMTAMDTATNNAADAISRLTLYMNKVRQAAITKEIIEVVSGAGDAS